MGRAYVYDQPSPLNSAAHYRIAELWDATNLQALSVGRRSADTSAGSSSGQNGDKLGAFATVIII